MLFNEVPVFDYHDLHRRYFFFTYKIVSLCYIISLCRTVLSISYNIDF